MENIGITKNQMINQILHVGHGDLQVYKDIGLHAANCEPELFAHLIAWNEIKGEVRDSKVALPIIALRGAKDEMLYENAAAHLCKLDPRNLLRACKFHRELPMAEGGAKWLKMAVNRYIKAREGSKKWWDRTALQHRNSLKGLYALYHIKPNQYAQMVLFDKIYPSGSVFEKVKQLRHMSPDEAAGTILNEKIPFLIAVGALGGIKGKTDVILALIERMSGNELITNTNMLQKMGVFDNPALKAAYDASVQRGIRDKRTSSLKAKIASSAVKDAKTAAMLDRMQEQKLSQLSGIEGDWLVLGDRSGSMQESIVLAKQVASLIAQQVKGKVYLVFFNTFPTLFDVTGKTLSEIEKESSGVRASGGTAIGCGLEMLMGKGIVVNGIAICSDGGDNTMPMFHTVYSKYVAKMGIEPTVYFFHVDGDPDMLSKHCKKTQIMLEKFDVAKRVDYYSLPGIIQTLRTRSYSLLEEIMDCKLLTFADVFKEAA